MLMLRRGEGLVCVSLGAGLEAFAEVDAVGPGRPFLFFLLLLLQKRGYPARTGLHAVKAYRLEGGDRIAGYRQG